MLKSLVTFIWPLVAGGVLLVLGMLVPPPVQAANPDTCTDWVAILVSVEGRVEARTDGDPVWHTAALNERFCAGDELRTLENSRAALQLRNDTIVRLDQRSMVKFVPVEPDVPLLLRLFSGRAFFLSRHPRPLTIETPFMNAASGGTEYLIEVDEEAGTATLTVIEGVMHLSNPAGRLTVGAGESSVTRAGEAPAPHLAARPRDVLQWALYYPPVLSLRELRLDPRAPDWQALVAASIAAYQDGDVAGAFDALADAPDDIDDPRFYAYRASLLLSVGRIDEARADIAQSLALAPGNGLARALEALIAVVLNEPEQALELALGAAATEPDSPSVQIALSYAWQANLNLPEALAAAQAATRLDPDSALAWARVAELWMSQGYLDEALVAARRAEALNPREARFHTVVGFAHLTRIEVSEAMAAFEAAIAIDSADPLPRLGLGLAKIRKGRLAEGRTEIEIAAALDPANALIRSYLGKAYYEEKRDTPAAIQFDLAKQLDPNDPTPWMYDAIRKQTVNRPVEAVRDMDEAITLNDNRAIYRSRLLLDQDLAARSVSRGRIYEDLGFGQLALAEGWKSVNSDPTDYSAHRFLADSYAALPSSEIARQSALLTSQLLQPLNNNPVQPSLSNDSVLSAGSGVPSAGFNEYSQLFERDRVRVLISGIGGEQSTWGDELILSGVQNRYSWSLGQFRYNTDGFRENADIDQRIYNAFLQASLAPNLSVQAEARLNEFDHGDLGQSIYPDAFSPTYNKDQTDRTYRLGAHWAITPTSDVLISTIYQSHDEEQEDLTPVGAPGLGISATGEVIARITEAQYLSRMARMTFIAGGGYLSSKSDGDFNVFLIDPPISIFELNISDRSRHTNYYLYSLLALTREVNLSVGASADHAHREALRDLNRINPKLGVMWDITSATSLRVAGLRAVNRPFVSNQTIEPTQVAGFQQFFEDPNLARYTLYGVGLDHKFSGRTMGGFEATKRDMKITVLSSEDETAEVPNRFRNGRAYFYHTISNRFAVTAEYYFERNAVVAVDGTEQKLTTHRGPLGIRYFDPNGFFAGLLTSYVDQDGNVFSPGAGFVEPASSRFWVWDGSVGYRFARRAGIATIGVQNLADRRFRMQQYDFSGDSTAELVRLQPRRFVFARLTFNFE
jgi:tetratricopeptide (TPR) repeat protein